jgi:hypothetical protein
VHDNAGAGITLGLDTFGDVLSDHHGAPLSHPDTIRDLVEQACWPTRPAWTSSASASTADARRDLMNP